LIGSYNSNQINDPQSPIIQFLLHRDTHSPSHFHHLASTLFIDKQLETFGAIVEFG